MVPPWSIVALFCRLRNQMETSSALLVLCAVNSLVTGEFPSQRPVTRSFDVFFLLRLNKSLSKQSWGWWFEKASRSLWRHWNGISSTRSRLFTYISLIYTLWQVLLAWSQVIRGVVVKNKIVPFKFFSNNWKNSIHFYIKPSNPLHIAIERRSKFWLSMIRLLWTQSTNACGWNHVTIGVGIITSHIADLYSQMVVLKWHMGIYLKLFITYDITHITIYNQEFYPIDSVIVIT